MAQLQQMSSIAVGVLLGAAANCVLALLMGAGLAAIGLPSLLLIDFDYEPWFNTTGDTEDKCSPASVQAVGSVVTAYTIARLAHPAH